jgi:Raf kinase inhibitor-like YbhB/YbcL family protein
MVLHRAGRLLGWGVLSFCSAALLLANTDTNVWAKGRLKVIVSRIRQGHAIPPDFAFCVPAKTGHVTFGPNKSPAVKWTKGPRGTKSYAVIMYDDDVPSERSDVNKEGTEIPKTLKRIRFYHWILVDIPASRNELAPGADSTGVTPHGKPPGKTDYGVRGVNSYTVFLANNPDMKGTYGGYDGPCPPWNDSIAHHYHFMVYALDVPTLGLPDNFDGQQAMEAMRGHVLAEGGVTGVYALNPAVAKRLPK